MFQSTKAREIHQWFCFLWHRQIDDSASRKYNCNARICKRGQGRHLYELKMVSAECRAPSGFRKACIPHQHKMFVIIVVKTVKIKLKLNQRVLSTHKTSQEIEKDTIDSFESDISMIVWCERLRNNFVWCTRHIL